MDTNKKENNINIIIIAVGVVILLLVGFIVIKGCSNTSKNNEEQENDTDVVEKKGASEDIIKSYGMSKNDAIEIVKSIYNSDNFEFSAEINEDSKYIISVKNLISEKTEKYLVDPTSTSKSFYLITE